MGMLDALSKMLGKSGDGPAAELLRGVFTDCSDLEERKIRIGGDGCEATLFFIDGLVSGETVSRDVLMPVTSASRFGGMTASDAIKRMLEGSAFDCTVRLRKTADEVVSDLLNGFCAVVFDAERTAVTFETKSNDKRSIDTPKEEKVVKGSKDAFIEVLRTNTMLVRRKLRHRDLKIKEMVAGSETNTPIAIVYIEGFTNKDILAEVESRIKAMRTEGVLTASALEESLADQPKTPFPQLLNTERPDRFCLNVLEGRVGILVDGLPMGYLAPGTFAQFLKVPEDAANHFIVGSGLTLLRYMAMFLSLLLPAFYIAIAMYHQEMIPTQLLQSIIDAKQSVPFPAAFEVIIMLIAFELLQEAGLRLPDPIGQTVSIIGALIVGQSAVEAKIVSPVVVIVVAVAGISGYTMPNQDMSAALRICRFLLVVAAIFCGMFGLAVAFALMVYHTCTLESFGVPYMTPFVGTDSSEMLRALTRAPANRSRYREPALRTQKMSAGNGGDAK